jgi:hypothetical protein
VDTAFEAAVVAAVTHTAFAGWQDPGRLPWPAETAPAPGVEFINQFRLFYDLLIYGQTII